MILNIIRPEDKVKLYLEQQKEQEEKTGEMARVYQSVVARVYENGGIELYMPEEGGRAVMFPLHVRLEVLFETKRGLYRAAGLVEERYRADNRYMLRIALKSLLYRYHRKIQCCVPCDRELAYAVITKEQALDVSPGAGGHTTKEPVMRRGIMTETDGASVSFLTDVETECASYLLIRIQKYLIPAYLLFSASSPAPDGQFLNKAEFIWKDSSVLEDFIRYIFDERRKNRKKEVR